MIPQATTDVHEQQTTVDNNQQTMSKSWHSNKDVEVKLFRVSITMSSISFHFHQSSPCHGRHVLGMMRQGSLMYWHLCEVLRYILQVWVHQNMHGFQHI